MRRAIRSVGQASAVALFCLASGCLGYHVEIVDIPEVDPWDAPGELGTICVLRPQTFAAVAQAVHRDNGRVVGVTQGGRVYFCYRAEPGRHRVVARTDNDAALDVVVRAESPTFLRLQLNMGPDALVEVDEREARELLDSLDYVVARPTAAGVEAVTNGTAPAQR